MKIQTVPRSKKVLSMICASALALAMAPAAALAAEPEAQADGGLDVSGWITASNTPASQAAPEILGLTGIDELQLKPEAITQDNVRDSLKYILMGTTEWNENPNPYYYNTLNGFTPGVVYNTDKRSGSTGGVSNPEKALAKFGENASDDEVWLMLPDVIVGCRTTPTTLVDYTEDGYARAVEAFLELPLYSYQPVAVPYGMTTLAEIVDNTYHIAEVGDKIDAENAEKSLRYGSATQIAQNYEKYVKGIQGYIMKKQAEGVIPVRTIAVINGQNDDGTFNIVKTPANWSAGEGNRMVEVTTNVAHNFADSLDGEGNTVAVTANQLGAVDLIIITPTETGVSVDPTELGSLISKAYWSNHQNIGAIYKVNANSVEVGTNFGRILSCLYPEALDQSDMVAYYFDTFYHVKDDKIADAMALAMDGVRNADVTGTNAAALVDWTPETAKGYNQAQVQNKLNEGCDYLRTNYTKAKHPDLVQLTDKIGDTSYIPEQSEESKPDPKPQQINGWQGSKYYENGKAVTSDWRNLSNKWYYFDANGNKATGWRNVKNAWYYMNGQGVMQTGWFQDGKTWYYANGSGAMQTGWLQDGKDWYYLGGANDGAMRTGWFQDGKTWYYANGSGAMQTGWLRDGRTWYYLGGANDGAMRTGWYKVGAEWYYSDGSGAMQESKWIGNYYVKADGRMAKSERVGGYWVNASGLWVPGR